MSTKNFCKDLVEKNESLSKEKIISAWAKQLPDKMEGKFFSRKIKTPYGMDFEIIYNKKRAKSISYLTGGCPFNNFKSDNYFTLGNYTIIQNINPFSKNHRLIISKKHIPKPRLKDIAFAVLFSEVIDETVILSIKGSGAGVPAHLHFQTFSKKMPIINASEKQIFKGNNFSVGRINFPSYGIRVSGNNVAKAVFKIVNKSPFPYNLVINNGKVVIFPRTEVCPTEIPTWRFGATELSGFFVTRQFDYFKKLNKKNMFKYMLKATLPTKKLVNKFEAHIKKELS